jgi:hypothetical protein
VKHLDCALWWIADCLHVVHRIQTHILHESIADGLGGVCTHPEHIRHAWCHNHVQIPAAIPLAFSVSLNKHLIGLPALVFSPANAWPVRGNPGV